jgi:hypothetical protein
MADTIPHRHSGPRHLSAVGPDPHIPPQPKRRPDAAPGGALLSRAGALRLDQAELFLFSLDYEMLTADNPRAAYLLGLAELHLAGLIELPRAVTS